MILPEDFVQQVANEIRRDATRNEHLSGRTRRDFAADLRAWLSTIA